MCDRDGHLPIPSTLVVRLEFKTSDLCTSRSLQDSKINLDFCALAMEVSKVHFPRDEPYDTQGYIVQLTLFGTCGRLLGPQV